LEAKRHFSLGVDFVMLGPAQGSARNRPPIGEKSMFIRLICSAALVAGALAFSSLATVQAAEGDGIVKFKSAYPMPPKPSSA
jgi:hypothetical protein